MNFSYNMLFKPRSKDPGSAETIQQNHFADRAPGSVYVYSEEIVLAVNVMMATGRPLIIRGPSGSGKSSLARSIAEERGLPYIETVITSRTQARDLQWKIDLLKRLQDAQATQLSPSWHPYVSPGPLWWAFDPQSARDHVHTYNFGNIPEDITRQRFDPPNQRAVILIDEIDKADPDVPNNLLKPLGELSFVVEEIGQLIETKVPPLVFITTNDERDLPSAFLRRCVELVMPPFDRQRLVQVGLSHFRDAPEELLQAVADTLLEKSKATAIRTGTNAAEYLDIVRACRKLNIQPESKDFDSLAKIILMRHVQGK